MSDPIQIYGLRLWRDHLRIKVDVVLMENVSVTVLEVQLPADPDAAVKAKPIQTLRQANTAAIRRRAVRALKARRSSVAGHLEQVASGGEKPDPSVMRLAALLLQSYDGGGLVPPLHVDTGALPLIGQINEASWPTGGICDNCGAKPYQWHHHGCEKHARNSQCEGCHTDHLPGCTLDPKHINSCAVPPGDLFGWESVPDPEETDPAKAQMHQRIKEITTNAVCEYLCGDGPGHHHGCARHIKSRTCEECL